MNDAVLQALSRKKVLVTGASGLLGSQLLFELKKCGAIPIGFVRETSNTKYIDSQNFEKRIGDITDQESIKRACEGVDYVIHTAALVNFHGDQMTRFTRMNAFGALYTYRAALEAGVKRFVHLSSIVGIGAAPCNAPTAPLTEEAQFNLEHIRVPYIQTKYQAERLLLSEANSKTELVILNPPIVIAPSRHGADRSRIEKFMNRQFLPLLPNKLSVVDIRDISPVIVRALIAGEHKSRYLLTGTNLSLSELYDLLGEITGERPVRIQIPKSPLKALAWVARAKHRAFGGRKLRLYPDLAKMLDYDWIYDSARAQRELGFRPRPLKETLEDLYRQRFTGTFLNPG